MERIKLEEFLKLKKEQLLGKVFCFPTDTVYGLGAFYKDQEAIEKIYNIKNRPYDKPLANLCSSMDQITSLGIKISPKVESLINKYWPGALTIIFKLGSEKISFRMPNCQVALDIIDKYSILTTTSVNESGEKELNSYQEIYEMFAGKIDYFIDEEAQFSKIPSTVIDVSDDEIKVLRQGSIYIDIY